MSKECVQRWKDSSTSIGGLQGGRARAWHKILSFPFSNASRVTVFLSNGELHWAFSIMLGMPSPKPF